MIAALLIAAYAAVAFAAPHTLLSRNYGGVALYNNCPTTVYSFTLTGSSGLVHQSNGIAPGEWYWEPYQRPVAPFGATMKLGMAEDGSGAITQIEYSMSTLFGNEMLFYDLSNVNCGPTSVSSTAPCPFLNGGMYLRLDDPSCETATCASGDVACHDAYNLPTDNWATMGCVYGNNNLVMYMCSPENVG
jgi:hypothetical protein